jgi:sterol desaturase/sphingolipid hydroxylase (fatty acid hydroxylase superfamily)
MNLPDPLLTFGIPMFVILIIAEMIRAKTHTDVTYEAKDAAASLAMGFGNTVARLLFGGIGIALTFWAAQFAIFDIGYVWWAFVLCFFLEDLSYYWFHRASHRCRWFWASHVVHHSSQHYNLSTALRQTWTGTLAGSTIFWMPLAIIGFPPPMIAFFSALSLVYQFWIHTEAIDRLGPLELVLNTPSHHRVHHATNPRYLDANYAGVLIIWDKLFGTFVEVEREDKPRYGIVANLATFNPFRIAFHEWVSIVRDVSNARSWKDRLHFLFAVPGWSPDGSRLTSDTLKTQWRKSQSPAVSE